MPARLPDNYKSLVIQGWLNGDQRDKIAADNGLSAGSVTNIVNEWRADVGLLLANALRELGVTLKRVGITPAQCALGFRTATLMHRIGVNEESFDSFIVDVYNRCKYIALSPQNIAFHLGDLLELSKTVPLSKIPDYVKEKTTEKRKLEEEIEKLKAEIETLQEQKEDAQLIRDDALEDARTTIFRLNWYTSIREDLGKYGISVDDTPKLAKLVNGLKQYEYDVNKVIKEFSNLENLRLHYDFLQNIIPSLENRKEELKRECSELQTSIAVHNQLLSKYHDLETMGFGLNKLIFLWTTVREIARENNLSPEEAATKFLSDVERQYNNKLGFESKVESLRNEVNKLNQEQATLRSELLLSPLVGPKLVKLTQNRINEQDIINIAAVFEKYVADKDRQSFVSELESYSSLKSATQELSKQYEKIRTELGSIQIQNRGLKADNQRISSSLVNSRHTFDIMQDSINSLRSEIPGLVSISADITRSIGLQFEYLEKLESNIGDGFGSPRTHKGEESVPIQDIKREEINAIENMESKPELTDRSTDALSNAQVALIDKDDGHSACVRLDSTVQI